MGHNETAMARPSDSELVERARAGDQTAFGALYDNWFDRVYDLAFRIVRDANAAADVAQDTFLSAWRELDGLSDPAAFGGWVRRIARNTALNRRKKDERARPVDSEGMAVIEAAGPAASAPAGFRVEDRLGAADDPVRAAEDSEVAALVWDAADALGERDTSILDLQLRHDMTPAEIADVVGVNRNHANQLVHRVRNRLGDALRARVLWRGGEPVCVDLRTALASAGVSRFGPDAVQVTAAHAQNCEECSERQRLRLAPTALFGATPFLVAPAAFKDRIAHALAGEGVPMDGSAHGPGRGGGRSRWRSGRVLAAAAAAAAIVLVVVAVMTALALTDDDGASAPDAKEKAAGETTTTAPTTTTIAHAPTSPIAPGPEGGAVIVPDPGAPPPPAPPPPPPPPPPSSAVTATLSVTPSTMQSPYPNNASAPVVQWSTSGGATAAVSGPGFSSSALSGSSPPWGPTASGSVWSVCSAAGSYTYTLTVRDGSGAVAAQRTATLTVSP